MLGCIDQNLQMIFLQKIFYENSTPGRYSYIGIFFIVFLHKYYMILINGKDRPFIRLQYMANIPIYLSTKTKVYQWISKEIGFVKYFRLAL